MGIENEFGENKNNNYESNLAMNIEINKSCYSKGEIIQGYISIFSKNILEPTTLINPFFEIILKEMHYYLYCDNIIKTKKISGIIGNTTKEENFILLSKTLVFKEYNGLNISSEALKIPFQIKIPETAYPSCIFDSNSYVKHSLVIKFPFIKTQKTLTIIIKNNIYFSNENRLLKSPLIIKKEISKHQMLFLNSGSFKFNITLPKNIFSYEEVVPFLIDIESNNLSFYIKGITVSLYRIVKYNQQNKHNVNIFKENKELISKYIPLTKKDPHMYIEDKIQLPIFPEEFNPKVIYSILDNERKNLNYDDKFKNIKLFPACYGGLLSCQYFIKFIFDMESFLTTNEEINIPLDFYERFTNFKYNVNINEEMSKNETDNDNNIIINDELPEEFEIKKQNYNKNKSRKNNNTNVGAPPPNKI
jgi:hypothetical protein